MSILKLQTLEPVNTTSGVAVISLTSSSSSCCSEKAEK
jgi:hypothetical protein